MEQRAFWPHGDRRGELVQGHSAIPGLTFLTCKEELKALGRHEGGGQLRRTHGHKHSGVPEHHLRLVCTASLLGQADPSFSASLFPITPFIRENAYQDTTPGSSWAGKAKADPDYPRASWPSRQRMRCPPGERRKEVSVCAR